MHKEEIKFAYFILNNFGGNIHLLKEPGNIKISDYLWNGKKWDLKTPVGSGKRTIDNQFKSAKEQIKSNPGGIFLDISKINIEFENVIKDIDEYSKARFFNLGYIDIMIVKNNRLIYILRSKYKK